MGPSKERASDGFKPRTKLVPLPGAWPLRGEAELRQLLALLGPSLAPGRAWGGGSRGRHTQCAGGAADQQWAFSIPAIRLWRALAKHSVLPLALSLPSGVSFFRCIF